MSLSNVNDVGAANRIVTRSQSEIVGGTSAKEKGEIFTRKSTPRELFEIKGTNERNNSNDVNK